MAILLGFLGVFYDVHLRLIRVAVRLRAVLSIRRTVKSTLRLRCSLLRNLRVGGRIVLILRASCSLKVWSSGEKIILVSFSLPGSVIALLMS